MKQITLDELGKKFKLQDYRELYNKILELITENQIKPIKASGLNGKKPALYRKYWLLEETKDYSNYIDELLYQYVPIISTEYYLKHLEQYDEDRKWLQLLNIYLKKYEYRLAKPAAMNERSFDIWHREKFLKEEQGNKILKRCKLDIKILNIYETTEPLAYYVHTKKTPQNMLILENKDTFYSMRMRMLGGIDDILGIEIGTLIYGAGKGIHRSFQDFDFCGEPYMKKEENVILYLGDIDYEGIGIFEKFVQLFGAKYHIKPFFQGYSKMIDKAYEIGIESLPRTKEGQNQNIGNVFFNYFDDKRTSQMKRILEEMKYIPQEILKLEDL